MRYTKALSLLLLGTTLVCASSLSVYQNKAYYTFSPEEGFIGLTKGVSGKCRGESVLLQTRDACPDSERICGLYTQMGSLSSRTHANGINMRILESLITLPKPASVDAKAMIEAARAIAKEETRLTIEKEKLAQETKRLKKRFAKEARATQPLWLVKPCKKAFELTLPYGYLSFDTEYEATLLPGDEVEVTQKLSVINRSGVDIDAEHASFHYRSSDPHLSPVHFSPWIVSERKVYPVKKRMLSMAAEAVMQNDMGGDIAPAAPAPAQARYERSREYTVSNLTLPSTGEPKLIPVMTWKVPVSCRNELYAYRNPRVFEVCSFTPKFQIEHNRWKVGKGEDIINEKAVGEYDGTSYKLYTRQIEDIGVVRKKIVQKERETGIFGGTARKKDGFTLTLTNRSDKEQKLTVTERIPTSTTEKIKVKLLSVHGTKAVDYHLLKEGKLTMNITLAPKETQKIEVLFEISYDKDLKIGY
jgi:hypothetical protein